MMNKHFRLNWRAGVLPIAALALTLTASPAWADKPLWELGLGAGWLHLPHYRGSDQTRDWLLPIPYFVYRGDVFRADREGARARLLDNTGGFDLDLSAAVNTPTRSRDNRAREGMANLAPTVEIGPSLNYTLTQGAGWQLDLRLPARAVFTVARRPASIGWTANPVLYLAADVQNWDVVLQAGPVWSGRAYNRYFYDVASADARLGRPAYESRGGNAGWVATATASRRLGPVWIGTYMQADGLGGAVFADSPLLRKRLNISYGIGLSWVFSESSARAKDGS
jgi:MipA family protein